jgi:hypothetical protein
MNAFDKVSSLIDELEATRRRIFDNREFIVGRKYINVKMAFNLVELIPRNDVVAFRDWLNEIIGDGITPIDETIEQENNTKD